MRGEGEGTPTENRSQGVRKPWVGGGGNVGAREGGVRRWQKHAMIDKFLDAFSQESPSKQGLCRGAGPKDAESQRKSGKFKNCELNIKIHALIIGDLVGGFKSPTAGWRLLICYPSITHFSLFNTYPLIPLIRNRKGSFKSTQRSPAVLTASESEAMVKRKSASTVRFYFWARAEITGEGVRTETRL